jgi:hypothetical protein
MVGQRGGEEATFIMKIVNTSRITFYINQSHGPGDKTCGWSHGHTDASGGGGSNASAALI